MKHNTLSFSYISVFRFGQTCRVTHELSEDGIYTSFLPSSFPPSPRPRSLSYPLSNLILDSVWINLCKLNYPNYKYISPTDNNTSSMNNNISNENNILQNNINNINTYQTPKQYLESTTVIWINHFDVPPDPVPTDRIILVRIFFSFLFFFFSSFFFFFFLSFFVFYLF